MMFTQGKTEITPAEAGYDSTRLDILKGHFQSAIDDGEIQCATYCIARKGKVFAHGALGKKSFREDDNSPCLPDSIRYIASMTKPFTAVAIMKLVEDGITRLDVPVGAVLPQFSTPPYNSVTLFHLLTHTSGMYPDGGCLPNKYQTNYWAIIDKEYRLHNPEKDGEFDWISAALGTIGSGLRVPPGTEWAYCSFGFTILGAVIEKLTGMKATQYIEDNIIKPLGMKDTLFDENLTSEMAKRYIVSDERLEKEINDVINGTIENEGIWRMIPPTSGALNSTAYDLVRFGNMMLNNGAFNGTRILGRKAVEKMTEYAFHNIPDYCWGAKEPDRGYGIGFDMRKGPAFTHSRNTYMHEGSGACATYIDPKEEIVAAWIVPYAKGINFSEKVMWNTQNVIWSGLI